MSSRTRSAAFSFSGVSLPIICVLTGPCAGNVSRIVSDWNRTAASVSTVENTPQAPAHGSVRSSYFMPSTSRPLTNISVQSLREAMSASTISMMSLLILPSSSSSISSAKFLLKSESPSSLPPISTSTLISTSSGRPISISKPEESSFNKSPSPCGAAYIPLSIEFVAIFYP